MSSARWREPYRRWESIGRFPARSLHYDHRFEALAGGGTKSVDGVAAGRFPEGQGDPPLPFADVEVWLLGPFGAHVEGRPVAVTAPRERALLAALALEADRVVSVDALLETLWGEAPPASATKTLQTYVAHVRRAITTVGPPGSDVLATEAPGYRLRISPEHVDALKFEALLQSSRRALDGGDARAAAGAAEEALSLWRGSPLEEFVFSDRLQAERRVLEERRLDALEDRAAALVAVGRYAEVLSDLQRLVDEHPLRERLWEQLVRALYAAGRQADALAAYQRCRTTLADELGLEPSPSLRALEQQVLTQDPSLTSVRPAPPGGSERVLPSSLRVRARAQMFGRASELERLDEIWEVGEPAVVLISGEAGIGKTQLVAAAARRLAHGARILYGRSDEGSGIPLQPFVEALDPLVSDLRGEAGPDRRLEEALYRLAHVLPSAPTREGSTPAERQFVFDAFTRLLGASSPVVLVVDDMHWADTASVLLLQHLARSCQDQVLIVATYRDTDISNAPLRDALAALMREPVVERMHLGPLQDPDARAIVDMYVHGADEATRGALLAEANGNPLFLHETARFRAANEHGAVGHATAPDTVREFVRWRLDKLGPGAARAVEAAAVLGVSFRPRVALAVAGLDGTHRELDLAAETGLVRPVEGVSGEWTFPHAVIRRAVYSLIGDEHRSLLHLSAGRILADSGGHPVAAANHLEKAGDRADRSLLRALWIRAAEEALDTSAYEAAVDFASRAANDGGSQRETCEALIVMSRALWRLGRFAESRAAAIEAAENARSLRDGDAFARAALVALGDFPGFDWGTGHPEAVPLLRWSRTELPAADLSLAARVAGGLASVQPVHGVKGSSLDERRQLAAEAIELATRSGDDATRAWVLMAARWGCTTASNVEERLALAERAALLAERAGDVSLAVEGHVWCFADRLETGDVGTARAHLVRVQELGAYATESYVAWAVVETSATLALIDGDLGLAERLSTEAVAINRPGENKNSMHAFGAQQLLIHWSRGTLSDIAPMGSGLIEEIGADIFAWRAAKAVLLFSTGQQAQARALYDDLLDQTAAFDDADVTMLLGALVLAELADQFRDRRGAQHLYETLLPYRRLWPTIGGGVTMGAVSRTLGLLAVVFGDLDAAVLHAQEAVDVHAETPLFRVASQLVLARALFERAGGDDRVRAVEHVTAAEALAQRSGALRFVGEAAALRERLSA